MIRTSLLLLLPALLMSTACERHTASSLPAHDEHSVASQAVAAAGHAPAPAPVSAEKSAPEAAAAPKFFEQKGK